ncbi:pyridoxamine 5'-phosphate oxidase-domain-containing protein [Powellomyces hirtus]|nr:pyridoxamine 5'-phosphate oxidase-domain-containing protein [Powellomyces hirtus]
MLFQQTCLCFLIALFGITVTAERNAKESALLARKLVASAKLGDIGTIMAHNPTDDTDIVGLPFSTPEYIADDCPSSGDILVYLVTWGTHARNARVNPAASITIAHPDFINPPKDSRGSLDEARVAIVGNLERISGEEDIDAARKCFLAAHPDAATFPHSSAYFRLKATGIRWIGGFGDRHFNGWVPAEWYHDASIADEVTATPLNLQPRAHPRRRTTI